MCVKMIDINDEADHNVKNIDKIRFNSIVQNPVFFVKLH